MKNKHRQVRLPEALDARIHRQMAEANQCFSEAVRDLVEKGLDYGDIRTYNLAKSVSQLADSYGELGDQVVSIQSDLRQLVETVNEMHQTLAGVNQLVRTADARSPTIIRTLAELKLLGRALGYELGVPKMKEVGEGIPKMFEMLMRDIGDEVHRRADEIKTAPRRRRGNVI